MIGQKFARGEIAQMTLKRIGLEQLELGMFVHKLEGGWFDHPFWRAKFLIEDRERLDQLKSSRLSGVVIDVSQGKDVTCSKQAEVLSHSVAVTAEASRIKGIRTRTKHEKDFVRATTFEEEIHAAQAIATKAKHRLHSTFVAARLGKAINVKAVEPVVVDILASVRRNRHAFSGLMRCKLKNEVMFYHALSVSALMVSLASHMKLSRQDIHNCGLAGLLLDIGANYLPQDPAPANGDFRNLDRKIWQQHPVLGHRGLMNSDDLPQAVLDACLQHHECFDGSGYPHGLIGDQIALIARMAAICDTFDFLLTKTNTVAALDPAAAIEHMNAMKGAFDPNILRQFTESVGLYPVGSFVELNSAKLAMVIDEDRRDYAKPVVLVFYCLNARERIPPCRLQLAQNDLQEEIIGLADLSDHVLPEQDVLRELLFLSTYQPEAAKA